MPSTKQMASRMLLFPDPFKPAPMDQGKALILSVIAHAVVVEKTSVAFFEAASTAHLKHLN